MGCNGMAELFAGSRVSGGDRVWLRPVRPDGRQLRPDDVDAGVPTQNWSLRYMRPQCPAHREGRAHVDLFAHVLSEMENLNLKFIPNNKK